MALLNHSNTVTTNVASTSSVWSWLPLAFMAEFTLVYNALIIVAYLREVKLRSSKSTAHPCFVSQALADFFCGVVFVPSYAAMKNRKDGELTTFVAIFVVLLNTFGMIACCLERCLSRRYKTRSKTFGKREVACMLAIGWLCSLIVSLLPLAFWFRSGADREHGLNIFMGTVWVSVIVSIILIALAFALAFRKTHTLLDRARYDLKNRSEDHGSIDEYRALVSALDDLEVTKSLAAVCACSAFAFFPMAIYELVKMSLGHNVKVPGMLQETVYVIVSKSVISPFAPFFTSKIFKAAVLRTLGARNIDPTLK